MQSLPPCTSCLFFMLLNYVILEIEKSDGICSPAFDVDEFLGFFYIYLFFLLNIQDLHQ